MRDINPVNNNGSIQLKFTFGGKRYSFSPIPGADYSNKRHYKNVAAIATRIHNDILAGCFDPTLDRYRLVPKACPKVCPKTLLDLWDLWVASLNLPEATKANHYQAIRQMLVKANPSVVDTQWLLKADLAPSTFNKRLSYIKSCYKWALKHRHASTNPFEDVKSRKVLAQQVQPFSTKEILAILLGFDQLAPHYTPFVKFLFLSGVRLSEAIGLRWSHIDFDRNELTIKESLSRDKVGNKYQRVRKETKNNTIRTLTMSLELRDLLITTQTPNQGKDNLVFTTVEGCIISPENFRSRYWVEVLKAYNVPYRKPHTTRHTTLSMAIEQGIPITGVAYLAGHTDTRMVIQTYGHMINRPKLPDLPI